MPIHNKILEELLKDYKKPEDLLGKDDLFKELTIRRHDHARHLGSPAGNL